MQLINNPIFCYTSSFCTVNLFPTILPAAAPQGRPSWLADGRADTAPGFASSMPGTNPKNETGISEKIVSPYLRQTRWHTISAWICNSAGLLQNGKPAQNQKWSKNCRRNGGYLPGHFRTPPPNPKKWLPAIFRPCLVLSRFPIL